MNYTVIFEVVVEKNGESFCSCEKDMQAEGSAEPSVGVVLSDSRVVGRWVTVGLSVNSGVGEVHPEE